MAVFDSGSPEFLQCVLDSLPDPVFVKDREHRFVAFNDGFCRLLGHPREALLGRSDPDFFPPEQAAVFWAMDDRLFASGEANENEEALTAGDGIERTIWTRKRPLRGPDGAVVGLCGAITDVTELRQRVRAAERALQESDHQRRQIAAQAELLAALSLPVVEVAESVLLVPLVGELSGERLARATDDLLASVHRGGVRLVLLDLTGVPAIDTAVARDLLRAVEALALLGCRTALCGIRPEIARTLVGLQVDLGGLRSFSTLRSGLAHAQRLMAT